MCVTSPLVCGRLLCCIVCPVQGHVPITLHPSDFILFQLTSATSCGHGVRLNTFFPHAASQTSPGWTMRGQIGDFIPAVVAAAVVLIVPEGK